MDHGVGPTSGLRRSWALALTLALIGLLVMSAQARAESGSSQARGLQAGHLVIGDLHTCAVLDAGTVRCWGFGADARLGLGSLAGNIGDDETPASVGPIDLGPGRTARALAAGIGYTCALLDTGQLRCWGLGAGGRLGYGNTASIGDDETPASVGPVDLGPGRTATAIGAGDDHACAILDTGQVRCWGAGSLGRLGYANTASIGDDETPASVGPVDLGPGRTATAISAGVAHTCAILDTGQVRCWGNGVGGRLGGGTTATIGDDETPASVGPVDLGPGRTAMAISAGGAHTCALLDTGQVRCWGAGAGGRLGYGNAATIGDDETPASAGPVDLGPGRTATAISAGEVHTCALLDTGQVRCWGMGAFGRLGYGNTADIGDNETPASAGPVDLGPGRTAVAVSTGQVTCALLDTGRVRCWGSGSFGRLGYGNTTFIGDDETPGTVGPVDLAGSLVTRVAALSLDLQSAVGEAQVGEQVGATLIVRNEGPDPTLARMVVMGPEFRILAGAASTGSFSADTGLWTIDRLAAGQSATLQLAAEVLAPGTPGLIARVTSQSAVDPAAFPAPGGAGPEVRLTFAVPPPPPVEVEVPGPTVQVPVPGPPVTVTGPGSTITVPGPTVTVRAPAPPPPLAFTCTLVARRTSLNLPTTSTQLAINQRIATEALRRLNAIRARLEGRPAPAVRRPPPGRFPVTTQQLRINQRIAEAAFARAREIYQLLGGRRAPTLTPMAETTTLTRAGVGANQLTNIRALDLLNCINANLD